MRCHVGDGETAQQPGNVLPDVGWPALFQANILREWNELDAALTLVLRQGWEMPTWADSLSGHPADHLSAGEYGIYANRRGNKGPTTSRAFE